MKSKAGFRVAALALLAVGLLSVPTVAQAHKKKYPTSVTATAQNKNQVRGNVVSVNSKCQPNRSVRLYSPTGVLEATVTTDSQGAFRIDNKDLVVGTHTVNVPKRVIKKNSRHKHICGGAQTSFVIS
jgi:hypothetical protein